MRNSSSPLTITLQALIEEEQQRTFNARQRLGNIIPIAQQALSILNTSVVSINQNNGLIAAFMLGIQKSVTLAYLSYVRGHTAQAEFNCRQAIELTALGAYLLANQNVELLDETDPNNPKLKASQYLSKKAYRWLGESEPELNRFLKEFKDRINESTAHGSIYVTHLTVDLDSLTDNRDLFVGSFFDNLGVNEARTFLMSFCRLVVLIIETMRRANEKSRGIVFKDDLKDELDHCASVVDGYRIALGEVIRRERHQASAKPV